MARVFALVGALSALSFATGSMSAEIGVVLPGRVHYFWQAMTRGIQSAADQAHVELVIRSPADGAALAEQKNIQLKFIDYLVARGVIGIVLAPEPLEGVAIPVSIRVPTVLIDRSNNDFQALSLVATDNHAAGRIAAGALVPVLHKGAKIALLRLAANISSTTARENGFLAVAKEQGWDVVIDTYVGFQFRESEELEAKALKAYPGRIDAVFAPSEAVAYGTLHVVESMPAQKRPRVVAFDWRPEFRDALKGGLLHAVVVQDPYRMGYRAVESLLAAAQGHAIPAKQVVEVTTVTQDNLDTPPIRKMLAQYGE